MTSNDLRKPQKFERNKPVKKSKLKGGGILEINDGSSDGILHSKNL